VFDKVLIANRGEIALRIQRACRELGLATVAVHSPIDAGAPHALAADEAVALPGDAPDESYLDIERLVAAARDSGAQAVHPGYGFLSENGDFAAACGEAGLVFVGPPAEVLRAVGDKLQARRLAAAAGVPVLPGTSEPSADEAELLAAAGRIGLPLMIKAAAGGGGKGMRRVEAAADLPAAVAAATSEARAAFGDGRVYLERCLEPARHVEVQVLADARGAVIHLYERDCSVQRRHQKIIEEAPAPGLAAELRQRLCQAAVAVAEAAGYRNAGTVEFLLGPEGDFYFLEVNARLQVEHPVTEAVCGVDLVRAQLEIAAGRPLALGQAAIQPRGHAIECRLYAEDPAQGFMPSPGRVLAVRAPAGPGVRFDCGVAAGSPVPVEYDPILAKLICWAADRPAALARMGRALEDTALLGVHTAGELLLDIVRAPAFASAALSTDFIERQLGGWQTSAARARPLLLAWLAAELGGGAAGPAAPDAGAAAGPDAADPWRSLGRWRMEG
jgi:acetyl-CoA carboxylase biotin carboxylase subunit